MGGPTEGGWAEEVLAMIAARLEALGCQHPGLSHQSTPPMFYDDWIACVVGKREAESARLREQAEALAAALETALYYAETYAVARFDRGKVADARAALRAYREPWATVHTKYLDDQLVERCITCLERWPCKEDNHDRR